jgi:hypothetical protein
MYVIGGSVGEKSTDHCFKIFTRAGVGVDHHPSRIKRPHREIAD